MDGTVVIYLVYLLISAFLTVWVATTLARYGRVFLVEVFGGNVNLAHSINRLLQTGFYLVSFGFVALWLRLADPVRTARDGFEALSLKIGIVLLVLGAVHLLNIYLFNRIRRRNQQKRDPRPPAQPSALTQFRPGPVHQ